MQQRLGEDSRQRHKLRVWTRRSAEGKCGAGNCPRLNTNSLLWFAPVSAGTMTTFHEYWESKFTNKPWEFKGKPGRVILVTVLWEVPCVRKHKCVRAVPQPRSSQHIPLCTHTWSHSHAEVPWPKKKISTASIGTGKFLDNFGGISTKGRKCEFSHKHFFFPSDHLTSNVIKQFKPW